MKHLLKASLLLMAALFVPWPAANTVVAAKDDGRDNEISRGKQDAPHSRQKRLLWITTDGRLALPPGTTLSIVPSLSLPFIRNPPEGFKSAMGIDLPFTIKFDELGLTDNENPFGAFQPLFARSLGSTMGSILTGYVADFMSNRKSSRHTRSIPALPKPIHTYFKGGERALLYTVVEDMLTNFGMDGKACLLRAICEVHSHTALDKLGFVGEFLELFLSASRSDYANIMTEYVTAETTGKHKECFPYFKECPKSLFLNKHNYSNDDFGSEDSDVESMLPANDSRIKVDSNEIDSRQRKLSADVSELQPM